MDLRKTVIRPGKTQKRSGYLKIQRGRYIRLTRVPGADRGTIIMFIGVPFAYAGALIGLVALMSLADYGPWVFLLSTIGVLIVLLVTSALAIYTIRHIKGE